MGLHPLSPRVWAIALLCALAPGLVRPAAANVITLFSTGVDSTGTPLPGGSSDPHWTVVAGPGISTSQPAVVLSNQLAGTYAQSPNSSWVWVNASGNAGTGSPYTFRLTFDLTGLNPSTASISGAWAVDNVGQIDLNGASAVGTGVLIQNNSTNFSAFSSFAITGGFVAGLNTLDFLATDQGNPGGLNVNSLVGTAQPAGTTTPEPTSLLLLGMGGIGLLCHSLRRRIADQRQRILT